ncbi:hypothetical protein B0I27_10794 [Arcticibacter pallidicorallinus]|uniref:Uncharacterized protein n=1 Tax=Arcticibacter pallidicorallinus TaxID=1259464 RepID=A0A2T0U0Z0_9SPHI|nr:hypothetical protein [Arcticibacter pallidicorallinus]PRY51508.1 hypothetical protein B0I27_10794 [Arcticibacter pallidicorallinus]
MEQLNLEQQRNTVCVLTVAHNDYDQHGDYLVAVFFQKPTRQELLKTLYGGKGINKEYYPNQHKLVGHILTGGGRTEEMEYQWYYLRELRHAEVYTGYNPY